MQITRPQVLARGRGRERGEGIGEGAGEGTGEGTGGGGRAASLWVVCSQTFWPICRAKHFALLTD